MSLEELPDGAMVQQETESYLIAQRRHCGGRRPAIARVRTLRCGRPLLTPPSTLRAMSAGYRPVLHPSAS